MRVYLTKQRELAITATATEERAWLTVLHNLHTLWGRADRDLSTDARELHALLADFKQYLDGRVKWGSKTTTPDPE